jgi:hypothetical protein
VSAEGVNNNQAESFFSRLRRWKYGVSHGVRPTYLAMYVGLLLTLLFGNPDDAVCAEQCVDGAPAVAGDTGMSASAKRLEAAEGPGFAAREALNSSLRFATSTARLARNLIRRRGRGFADLP